MTSYPGLWVFWFPQSWHFTVVCEMWRIPLCLKKNNVHTLIWKYFIAAAAKSLESCLTLCNPINGSLLGSSVPEITKWCQNNYNSNIKDHWQKVITNNNNEKSLNILRITEMWHRHKVSTCSWKNGVWQPCIIQSHHKPSVPI